MTPPEKMKAAFLLDDPDAVRAAVEEAVASKQDVVSQMKSVKWYFRPWLLLQDEAQQHRFAVWCFDHTTDENPIIYEEAKAKQGGWHEAMESARLMAVAEEQKTGSPDAARDAQQDYLIKAFLGRHHPDVKTG